MPAIGVVSDTHLPRFGSRLPRALLDGLARAGVERVLHAGDLTGPFVLEMLGEVAPVIAVAGNNDPAELREQLGTHRIVELGGRRIGLTHGHLGPGRTTPERARRAFEDERVDLVVFGHSHQPLWLPPTSGSPGLLNPGSPTDRRREPACSFAILELEPGRLEARFERYTDRTS